MINPDDRLEVVWLPLDVIDPGPAQPYDPDTAATFAAMMAAGPPGCHLAPVMVSPHPDEPGRFRVRDGHHRYLAHVRLGRELVRCLIVHPVRADIGATTERGTV